MRWRRSVSRKRLREERFPEVRRRVIEPCCPALSVEGAGGARDRKSDGEGWCSVAAATAACIFHGAGRAQGA